MYGNPHGLVPIRGASHHHGGGGNPDLAWHGGEIMTSAAVQAIYWGTSWSSSSFTADKITGLDTFYSVASASAYIGTNTEYTGTNGQVVEGLVLRRSRRHVRGATQRASDGDTRGGREEDHQPGLEWLLRRLRRQPRGHAGYCAWHSYGTIKGMPVQFAFFFNLDGDAGCDPQDPATTNGQGLAALANVSGHELWEAVTDPRNGGW